MARAIAFALLVVPALLVGQSVSDTVGFTDRDRQVYATSLRYVVNDTLRGTHAVWKDGFGDIRYNFCPRDSTWRWPDGTVINEYPRNLGCLDVDITNGAAVVSTDFLTRGVAQTAYLEDTLPGQAGFVERYTGAGFRHNLISTTNYGWPKFLASRNDTVFFSSGFSYRRLDLVGPFPAYSLASSKKTGRFGCIWAATDGPRAGRLFLQETPNNGQSWYPVVPLSDSLRSRTTLNRNLLGAAAYYDSIRLYLVAGFHDGSNPSRSELWLYSKYDSPPWYPVHRFELPETVRVGDNALAAGRPTIAFNPRSAELYVAWEQFDPDNIEPLTGLARADVWAARSTDRGRTWGEPVRLTAPDQSSKRFPFLAEVACDTLELLYFADQVAGFWEQGQGPPTRNPVIRLRFPASGLPASGIAQQPVPFVPSCRVVPAASRHGFEVITPSPVEVRVVDVTGRCLARLRVPAGRTGIPANLPPGLYLVRLQPRNGPAATARFIRLP